MDVWFYDYNTQLNVDGTYNDRGKTILSGSNLTYNVTSGYSCDCIIAPLNAKITGTDLVYDGTSSFSGWGTIIDDGKGHGSNYYSIATRGVHLMGKSGKALTTQSFTVKDEKNNISNFWGNTKYFYNRGTLIFGEGGVFSGQNDGLLLMGDTATHEVANSGVVISANPCTTRKDSLPSDVNAYSRYTNRGIIICGPGNTCNYLPNNDDGTPNNGRDINSFIRVSDFVAKPTELRGYFKLTEDCHILDANGNEIELTKNNKASQ